MGAAASKDLSPSAKQQLEQLPGDVQKELELKRAEQDKMLAEEARKVAEEARKVAELEKKVAELERDKKVAELEKTVAEEARKVAERDAELAKHSSPTTTKAPAAAAPVPGTPKSQAVLDIEAEAEREEKGYYCRFYCIDVAEFRKFEGNTMPSFQEIREKHPKMLVEVTITFLEAMAGARASWRLDPTTSRSWRSPTPPRAARRAATNPVSSQDRHRCP